MGIEFVLGQFEVIDIINEKIDLVTKYLKADEKYLQELVDENGDKMIISVTNRDIWRGKARIKSLHLYADHVAMGLHRFTLDEIKALETL